MPLLLPILAVTTGMGFAFLLFLLTYYLRRPAGVFFQNLDRYLTRRNWIYITLVILMTLQDHNWLGALWGPLGITIAALSATLAGIVWVQSRNYGIPWSHAFLVLTLEVALAIGFVALLHINRNNFVHILQMLCPGLDPGTASRLIADMIRTTDITFGGTLVGMETILPFLMSRPDKH